MASQLPRSLAAHNTPGPFWGGAPAPAPAPPAPKPQATLAPAPPRPAPKPQQPLRLDPSLKRLHDELVAQKADPSILKDWTTEKRKDGPNRGDRVYYVDPHGKAHRSAPAARRAILQTGPATPPKKRKTQDKDRSQLVKWKLSGCTVAVTPAPPRTEASESELALEGKVFEDEGIRWRVDEVYFDEDVKALCASYYDFDARGFVPPDDVDAFEMTPLEELRTFAAWVSDPQVLTGNELQAAQKREDDRLDARRAARVAWNCIDALAARRLRRQPCMEELPVCAIGDTVKCGELMERHGVVVFRNVLSRDEIKTSEAQFWDWAETASPGLKRSDPKTHAELGKMGWGDTGIVAKQGIAQSPFMWGVRLAKGVRQAWATVLDSNELSVSFDGAGAWLNPHVHGESVATRGKWYHIDQFYGKTPHRKGFQGLVTLYEADMDTGSFVCLPGSHRDYERNCRGRNPLGNFVRMSGKKDADYCAYRAVQVAPCVEIKFYGAFALNLRFDLHAIDATPARWRGGVGLSPLDGASTTASSPRNDFVKNYRVHRTHWLISTQVAPLSAGDLIVWDSRVVHCSAGFDAKADPSSLLRLRHVEEQPPLARLVAYVACARKDAVSPSTREKRREAVRRGYGGNAFSSHDAATLRRAETPSGYKAPDAGSPVWDLV